MEITNSSEMGSLLLMAWDMNMDTALDLVNEVRFLNGIDCKLELPELSGFMADVVSVLSQLVLLT